MGGVQQLLEVILMEYAHDDDDNNMDFYLWLDASDSLGGFHLKKMLRSTFIWV